MAKGMSPLRLFMRNPSRKTVASDDTSSCPDGTRQPLGPITETVKNPLIPVAEQASGDPSTPRAKGKMAFHGQDKFPHLENSEVFATSLNVTPDKTASSHSKGKFTWQHRHGSTADNTPRDGPLPLGTPPRPPKVSASDGRAVNNMDTLQGLSNNLRGCNTVGGSVPSTPKTGKSVGGKPTTESENGGSQSQNATPCKNVSRSLKYGQHGSTSNSGASGLTNVRSTGSQHLVTRTMGYLQAVKGVLPQTTNQHFVEHNFELEEDASFWRDHNVQVIIRTRPISNSELASQGSNRCLKQESPHTVSWLGQPESRFTFDHVAGETITQGKLFNVAGLPMVENCMSGYNSCMFAYGQTGSGKTHTMLGDIENLDRTPSEDRGMTPRVFEYLFGRIRMEQECRRQEHLKFFCKCSFLEIYNEQITDLLEPSSTNLQMREDAKKGVYVENLSEVEVHCVQDVIQLLLQGAANRKVAATNMNRESSRSHSVFTCVVESKWENNSLTNSRYGRLHLVDLAGSERQKSSGAEGGRLKEAANINKSLSTLGLVIMILVDVANGRQRHVPYRDSKLTFLLQDSLGGNSKTIMIANVSPSSCCAMETLSTLKFAQRAKFIRNNAVVNENGSGDVIALRQRIEELEVEVERLRRRRDSMSRISLSRISALENGSVEGKKCEEKFNASTLDCTVINGSTSDSMKANESQIVPIANNDKHLRSIEAVLAGALRREQQAEDITKKLAAEIEQLNRLVRQREEDSQCSKMMLRFRDEKIRTLERVADNVITTEGFFEDERNNLIDELQLIRARLDRNPEVTRFAMENIRLMEELRRYQEFFDGGERDVLLGEISGLRSQLLNMLDTRLEDEQTISKLLTPQKRALAPELSALERENELLLIEVKSYQNELKECRNNLNSCLEANAELARQVDELQATVKQLKNEHSQKHEESREVPNRIYNAGASLPAPQVATTFCDPTTADIRLETEELALQEGQALTNLEEQILELRNQLKEAQDLIQKLSLEVEAHELSDRRKLSEMVPCIAEDDAGVRQGLQDRWEKVQDMEMRHSEEIAQLQLELDSIEDVLKEEREQRLLADRKVDDMSVELRATVSELEKARGLVEDGLKDERQQRLVVEQKSHELSCQLSVAISKLEGEERVVEALDSMEDVLKEEREQRLLADQKVDDLSVELRATVSELEKARGLVEDGLKDERQQRLVVEQKCQELSCQLSVAVSKLEEEERVVEALDSMEDVLKEEREQRLQADRKVDDLSVELRATVSELEKARGLVEDGLKDERQQRLVVEQKCQELSCQLSVAVSKLEEEERLVEALEGQQLFSINELEKLQSEHTKLLCIMSDWEAKMHDVEIEWKREKEALAQELTEAKLVANEKRTEAAALLQKFQDGQATLKEAEDLLDALVTANENAKHAALDWKTEKESLGMVQGWWMPEREKLVSKVGRLETDMHNQRQDIWITCKEAVNGLVETTDVLLVVDKELSELRNDHQQEMDNLFREMKALKGDLVAWLLDLESEQVKSFENMHIIVCELTSEKNGALKESADLRVEIARLNAGIRNLEAELEENGNGCLMDDLANSNQFVKVYQQELAFTQDILGDSLAFSEALVSQMQEISVQLEDLNFMQGVGTLDHKFWSTFEVMKVEMLNFGKAAQGDIRTWRTGRSLDVVQGSWVPEREKLISKVARLETDLQAQRQDMCIMCKEAVNALVETKDVLLVFDLELSELEKDYRRESDSLVREMKVLKGDVAAWLLDLEGEQAKTFENIQIVVCELTSETNRARKENAHLGVEIGSLNAFVRNLEAQLEDLANPNQFLQLYQQEFVFTQDILTGSLAISEAMLSQMQEISVQMEEVGTLDHQFRSDLEVMKEEILNFGKAAQEEIRTWTIGRNITRQENERLMAAVQDLQSKNSVLTGELVDQRHSLDVLAEELVLKEQGIAHSLQMMNSQLKAAENERDKYQTDLVVLEEQLEMAQTLADERDVVASEARQAAERSKRHTEEKEVEARILERSVEELDSTIYALESQLGIVKRESERHYLAREALEKELEALKRQIGLMHVTIESQDGQAVRDFQGAETSKTELDRIVIEMKNQQIQARKSVESLQQECAEKDVQLRSSKAHIAELMLGAEKQASENQQKLKTLEAMVELLKVEDRKVNPAGGSVSKAVEKSTGKVKGAGSPFKCIGSGLEKQRSSEMDEELSVAKKRIKELETVAASRQKEVFMLNTKLAEAESMTHDVVRDLLGVKMDIASYATLLNQQQVQRIAERARRRTVEAQQKEDELERLRDRLNEFIEERESWLEEINRRQAEAVAARVSAEKLRLRDQTLTAENEKFREDYHALRKKVADFEEEIKKLSGQQNLKQRIHHHAKIKEENNSIKLQNEDLSGKLRRMEILFTRVNDELARYRTAEGKSAFLNFDEEARLQKKLQETEENRLQLAETLIGLCTGIMQAAGIQRASRDLDPSAAMAALQQVQDRQESLERELSDYKLKARIAVEKRRLSDLREFHTPVKTICTNTNFTASQQLPSPVSSSR